MVTVFVAVAVSVASLSGIGAVKHHHHVPETLLVVVVLQHLEHVALEQSRPYDEERAVYHLVDYLRVGYHLDGRTVDEDIVVVLPESPDQFREPRLGEQFGRIGRHGAHRQQVECLEVRAGDYQRRHVVAAPCEIVADSPGGRAGIYRKRRLAQVAVYGEHLLALEGEAGCGVGREEGLSAADVERGEKAHAAALLHLSGVHHELEVGTQHPEGLVDHIAAALLDHDLACTLLRQLLSA